MGQENEYTVWLTEEQMQLAKQVAKSRYEHRLSMEAQFAEQHPELWEEIRVELEKFDYYYTNHQLILDDPEFCEQAMEDLRLNREGFKKDTHLPEELRSSVAQGIEFEISEYCNAAGKRGRIEWGCISWGPDTGLDLRKETNH